METSKTPESKIPDAYANLARVAFVMNGNYQVAINRGSANNIRQGQRFIIFGLGDEIQDPATNQSLGPLEIVRGTGKVIHVQDNIATIETDVTAPGKRVTREFDVRTRGLSAFLIDPYAKTETEITPPISVPFMEAEIGDFARPI